MFIPDKNPIMKRFIIQERGGDQQTEEKLSNRSGLYVEVNRPAFTPELSGCPDGQGKEQPPLSADFRA
jgi:hypothetical protein